MFFVLCGVLFKKRVCPCVLFACSMAIDSASADEEIAAIERDWNQFDMEGIASEWSVEIDLEGSTFTLTVSNFTKQGAFLEYQVSSEAESRYAVNSIQKVFRVEEGPGEMLTFPVVLLRYMTPSTPDVVLRGALYAYEGTKVQLAGIRGEGGWVLMRRYMEVLRQEAQWDREWRVKWDARKDHVLRALFEFFKGLLIDTRKKIYMLFKQFWYEEKR